MQWCRQCNAYRYGCQHMNQPFSVLEREVFGFTSRDEICSEESCISKIDRRVSPPVSYDLRRLGIKSSVTDPRVRSGWGGEASPALPRLVRSWHGEVGPRPCDRPASLLLWYVYGPDRHWARRSDRLATCMGDRPGWFRARKGSRTADCLFQAR